MSAEVKPDCKMTDQNRLPRFSGAWEVKRLGDIADLYQPVTISARQLTDSGYPVYGANGVVGFFSEYNHDNPQVTVTCRGSTCGTVNRTVEKSWITGNAMVINCDQYRGINKEFLYFLLLWQDLSVCITGTGQPQIVRGPLANFELKIPSDLEEQRAIASILSDMDTLISGLDQLITKKRDFKQAAMQQLLTGQKRLPGFSGEWELTRLGSMVSLARISIFPFMNPEKLFAHFSLPAFDEGKEPAIEPGSYIASNKFSVPEGAVLVSKLNPRIPRIWMPVAQEHEAVASTEFLVLLPKSAVIREFLYELCRSDGFCAQLEISATGTTGSHQRISPAAALDIEVSIPSSLDEQTAIATILSDMSAEVSALEARREKARQLKQGMMQELLTGRIRLV